MNGFKKTLITSLKSHFHVSTTTTSLIFTIPNFFSLHPLFSRSSFSIAKPSMLCKNTVIEFVGHQIPNLVHISCIYQWKRLSLSKTFAKDGVPKFLICHSPHWVSTTSDSTHFKKSFIDLNILASSKNDLNNCSIKKLEEKTLN